MNDNEKQNLSDIQRSVVNLMKGIDALSGRLTDADPDHTAGDSELGRVIALCDKALNASGLAFLDDLLIIDGIITKKLKETK